MNKNALMKQSNRKVETHTGKLPDSFGHSLVHGVTRKLTKRESEQQRKLQLTNTRPTVNRRMNYCKQEDELL